LSAATPRLAPSRLASLRADLSRASAGTAFGTDPHTRGVEYATTAPTVASAQLASSAPRHPPLLPWRAYHPRPNCASCFQHHARSSRCCPASAGTPGAERATHTPISIFGTPVRAHSRSSPVTSRQRRALEPHPRVARLRPNYWRQEFSGGLIDDMSVQRRASAGRDGTGRNGMRRFRERRAIARLGLLAG